MTTYKLKITPLNPLHIGNGKSLRKDFDFVVKDNKTYRFNLDRILEKNEALLRTQMHQYPVPGKLIKESDFQNSDLFRYILSGKPESDRTDAEVNACIKDVFDRPYIPGSSIKGALRTSLAWNALEKRPQKVTLHQRKAKYAGQEIEQKVFGRNPNHDIMRALQISDCQNNNDPSNLMMISNAKVVTKEKEGSPVQLETIKPNLEFSGSIKIDDFLFSNHAKQKLNFSDKQEWFETLMKKVQEHTKSRIESLINWFDDRKDCKSISNFYRQLSQILGTNLDDSSALLQLGWGTGWDSKTFGSHLQKDEVHFEKIVRQYRMNKAGRHVIHRNLGDPYPSSKRVVISQKSGKPFAPLGWVLIELEEII